VRGPGAGGVLEGLLDRIRAATGGRVLVVDDDGAVRDFLGDALRAAGYAVAAAPDAGAALDLLWAAWDDQPDVILLDLVLPAVDGRGFGELYHELPVRHAPVVLMSAVAEVERIAAETGAAAGLRKPFDLDELLATVARCARPAARRPRPDV
jgi:DNA-binding response OmpR family regulator